MQCAEWSQFGVDYFFFSNMTTVTKFQPFKGAQKRKTMQRGTLHTAVACS